MAQIPAGLCCDAVRTLIERGLPVPALMHRGIRRPRVVAIQHGVEKVGRHALLPHILGVIQQRTVVGEHRNAHHALDHREFPVSIGPWSAIVNVRQNYLGKHGAERLNIFALPSRAAVADDLRRAWKHLRAPRCLQGRIAVGVSL